MSLARSASGPGGLSINTGSTSLFGNTSQPAAGGGLFGTATSQPGQTGGSSGSSLFGTASSQPQQTGGLFGQTTTSQPQQTGGLFGSTTTGQQQQQQSQPAQTGGLFGTSTTTQQQPPTTGGLFGSSTTNTGGLFGKPATTTTSTTGTGTGLFGQTSKPQGTSLFGTQTQQTAPTSGLTMGQSGTASQQQQQQVVPGVRIDLGNIKPTTRFNELEESLQKEIAMIDEGIQKCIRDKEAVDAFLPAHGEQLAAIPTDVGFVTRKSEGAQSALSSDVLAIHQLRELVKQDADNARLSFKAIDNLKLPTQYHQAGLWSSRGQPPVEAGAGGGSAAAAAAAAAVAAAADEADAQSNTDLISFFSKTADEMDDMMRKFEKSLGEIEVHLHGVQGNMLEQLQRAAAQSKNGAGQGGVDERVVELAAVLRDFEESILKVAGVVGGVKEGITELQLKDFMGHGS